MITKQDIQLIQIILVGTYVEQGLCGVCVWGNLSN